MKCRICENTTIRKLELDPILNSRCLWAQHKTLASMCSETLTSPTSFRLPPLWAKLCILLVVFKFGLLLLSPPRPSGF